MSALTKAQAQQHDRASVLLAKDVLTFDEREFVLEHWRADADQNVRKAGAFFTPQGLSSAFADECNGAQSVIDLCAGIGALAYQRWRRDQPTRLVCVEANPVYIAVGRKVLPEAEWIHGDVFALPHLGRFDLAISNPPYGRVKRNGSGPRYRGSAFEYHVIDIASTLADQGVFLIPQTSAPFKFTGGGDGRVVEGLAYTRFRRETGITLCSGLGIDANLWRTEWHGVSPVVESVRVDFGQED